MQDFEAGGGLLTRDDLRSYRAAVIPALTGSYRGDAVHTCPWCGACYTAVSRPDPKTGVPLLLLMPVEMVPAAPPAKKAEGAFQLTPDVIGAQPLRSQDGRVFMSCFCGRELEVDPDAPQQDRTCPACTLSFQLVLAVEPGTHRPMVISLPRAKAQAKEKTA